MKKLFASLAQHPTGFWFLWSAEFAERCSFYGMQCLLMTFAINNLHVSQDHAAPMMHHFGAGCYLLAIVGGFVADRWLGRYWTIVAISPLYILGHILLGQATSQSGLSLPLFLLALGSGAIKPNVTPILETLYPETDNGRRLRNQAFNWFYMGINIGALVSMTALPLVRNKWGYSVALTCPIVVMGISFAIFATGRKHYPAEAQVKPIVTQAERARGRKVVIDLLGVFILLIPFWLTYNQLNSTWVLFTRDHTELHGMTLENIQAFNPFFIILLALISGTIWDRVNKHRIRPITPGQKITLGYMLVIMSLLIMTVCGWLSTNGRIDVIWEILAILFMTVAELCVVVTAIETVTALAPAHFKSTLTSILWTTVFCGNFVAATVTERYTHMNPGHYFLWLLVLMTVTTILFRFVAHKLDTKPTMAVS